MNVVKTKILDSMIVMKPLTSLYRGECFEYDGKALVTIQNIRRNTRILKAIHLDTGNVYKFDIRKINMRVKLLERITKEIEFKYIIRTKSL